MTAHTNTSSFSSAAQQNLDILLAEDMLFGIPVTLFVSGLCLTAGCYFSFHILFAVLFACCYFPLLYHLHRDDPRALIAIRRNLLRTETYWRGQSPGHRRLFFMRT